MSLSSSESFSGAWSHKCSETIDPHLPWPLLHINMLCLPWLTDMTSLMIPTLVFPGASTPLFGIGHCSSLGLFLQFFWQPFILSQCWEQAMFFRRIYQSLQDTEEKCGTENNIKLLLEMPTCKGELALASKEMEILPHSSRVPEFPSSVFTDCPVLIPFMKWLKVGTAILVREWDTPIHS